MSDKNNSYSFSQKILGAVLVLPWLLGGCGGGEVESQATGARAVPVKLTTLETATLIDSSLRFYLSPTTTTEQPRQHQDCT